MPFKSEAQRRYLWANEPEIARDWTDTYGSRIQKNNGGIMRLGFAEGDIVDDKGKVFEETEYTDLTQDQFNERFGGEYEENLTPWYQEDTLQKMWNDPDRPDISDGLGTMKNWATDKIGAVGNWGKRAISGIGNFMKPGLGFALGLLPRETAAQKFNRSFTVGGTNMPKDPYGYYNQLRHGNLNQDPFGRNPVSLFGNYSQTLLDDTNYTGDNKFKTDKADYARNYFNQKAAQYAPQEDININVTPASLGGGNGGGQFDGASSRSEYDRDPTGFSGSFKRGGIAGLWPR